MGLPVGDNITPIGTPYHIYQLVMLMLKETAKTWGNDDYPFKYSQDSTTTGLAFDTVFNKESDVYGTKPVIIMSRGGVSSSPSIIADLAKQNLRTYDTSKSSVVQSSISIRVMAVKPSEVDILANEVFNFLLACRTVLPQFTTIHTVTNITLSPIAEYTEGDHRYYCMLDLGYTLQYLWTSTIPLEILNSILVHLNHGTPEEREFIVS